MSGRNISCDWASSFRGRKNMKKSTKKLIRLKAKDHYDIKNSDKMGRRV